MRMIRVDQAELQKLVDNYAADYARQHATTMETIRADRRDRHTLDVRESLIRRLGDRIVTDGRFLSRRRYGWLKNGHGPPPGWQPISNHDLAGVLGLGCTTVRKHRLGLRVY